MTKALVVGYGSIGKRHERVLSQLGCKTSVVSRRRDIGHDHAYGSLERAVLDEEPDYVVIASRTGEHHADVSELSRLDFRGMVLAEKPLFASANQIPANKFVQFCVGYNLRFDSVVQQAMRQLVGRSLLSAQLYVGQYLPTWRPDSDYRFSYSASSEAGGGALLDLSHELDVLLRLGGRWLDVSARGGQLSSLEIDSDDVFGLLVGLDRCPVALVQLNYLDRVGRRYLHLNCDDATIEADLVSGVLWLDGEQIFSEEPKADRTYQRMHKSMLEGNATALCSAEEGLEVVRLVDAARRAVADQCWRSR